MMEYFWAGFEKRALDQSKTWKAKWHPEGKERDQVHKGIHETLKKNKKYLTPSGVEELESINKGLTGSNDSMWSPKFIKG